MYKKMRNLEVRSEEFGQSWWRDEVGRERRGGPAGIVMFFAGKLGINGVSQMLVHPNGK